MATDTGEVGGPWMGSGSNYRLVIRLWRTAVNVAGNTSTLRSQVWIETKNGASFYGQPSGHAQYIAGVLVLSATETRAVGVNSRTLVMDNSRVVSHDAAGNLNANAIGEFSNGFCGWINVSTSMWVDPIPRATTPNWSGDFEPLVAKTINLPRASAGFTHDVSYHFGTLTGTIATGAGVTTSWTPDMNLLTQITNAASGTGTITVVTKSGATVIGSKGVNFRLNAPASVVPNVTQVLWDDANTTVKANIGAFVQGLSLISGAVTSEALYGASITEERIRIGTTIVPENNPIQITGSGTVSAFGEAVDTRGRLGSLASSFPVLPYNPPLVNSWQVRRADASGTPSDTGQHLRLDLNALVSSLKPAATEKNAMTISVRTRPVGGAWTTRNALNPGITYNSNVLITGGAAFLVSASYVVEVSIVDKTGVSATVIATTVPTATVTLDLNGTKVGVGKYHERGALDVAGDIYSSGGLVSPYGSITAFAGPVAPAGWLLCDGSAVSRTTYSQLFSTIGSTYGAGNGSSTFNLPDMRGRTLVGLSSDVEFNELGKPFGTKTHTLTTTEMPSHQHSIEGDAHGVLWGVTKPNNVTFAVTATSGTTTGNNLMTSQNFWNKTKSVGGGGEHNNIQPSIAINYIIRA